MSTMTLTLLGLYLSQLGYSEFRIRLYGVARGSSPLLFPSFITKREWVANA